MKIKQPFVLPMSKKEMDTLGWDSLDILLVSGDAYVDHPSFGTALLGRWLISKGFKTGVVAQPEWKERNQAIADVSAMGRPRLFAGVNAGAIDSMLAHYTAFRKKRSDDAYTPGGQAGARPNRAVITYTGFLRQAYPNLPVVIGGIEASLRRMSHYDFWEDKLRRSILLDAKADILIYGMGERALFEIATVGKELLAAEGKVERQALVDNCRSLDGIVYSVSAKNYQKSQNIELQRPLHEYKENSQENDQNREDVVKSSRDHHGESRANQNHTNYGESSINRAGGNATQSESNSDHTESHTSHAESRINHAGSSTNRSESHANHGESHTGHTESSTNHAKSCTNHVVSHTSPSENSRDYAESHISHAESHTSPTEGRINHTEISANQNHSNHVEISANHSESKAAHRGDAITYSKSNVPHTLVQVGLDALAQAGHDKSEAFYSNGKSLHPQGDTSFIYKEIRIPSHEEIQQDPKLLMQATKLLEQQVHNGNQRIIQQSNDRLLIVNPPAPLLEEAAMDSIYGLPFSRLPHPSYSLPIPAWEMIRTSITTHRGCGGGCSFCSLALHQGRRIASRSERSLLQEAAIIAQGPEVGKSAPRWSGSISDVGGPSANMWQAHCSRADEPCLRESCMHPKPCRHFVIDQMAGVKLLRKISSTNGIRHVRVASGVRFDLALQNREALFGYTSEFTGGQLKVAPEHTSSAILSLMRKPNVDVFESFLKVFFSDSAHAGKEQYTIPYLMSAFPGCTVEHMKELKTWLDSHRWKPQQVQCFIPTPGTIATAMFYAGIDMKGNKMYVARSDKERMEQHHILLGDANAREHRTGKSQSRFDKKKPFAKQDSQKKPFKQDSGQAKKRKTKDLENGTPKYKRKHKKRY